MGIGPEFQKIIERFGLSRTVEKGLEKLTDSIRTDEWHLPHRWTMYSSTIEINKGSDRDRWIRMPQCVYALYEKRGKSIYRRVSPISIQEMDPKKDADWKKKWTLDSKEGEYAFFGFAYLKDDFFRTIDFD